MKVIGRLVLLLAAGALFAGYAHADVRTMTKQYKYKASEADNKQSARWTALEEARKSLLGDLVTYLETKPEVKAFQLTKDELAALIAGIARPTVTKEDWDGQTYQIEAKMSVDTEPAIRAIGTLARNHDLRHELEREYAVIGKALLEKESQNKDLEAAYYDTEKSTEDYEKTVKQILDRRKEGASVLAQAQEAAKKPGDEKHAAELRQKAIELLGEAVVLTELPQYRIYIPGKKYPFPIPAGEQTDHWIVFPDSATKFRLMQEKGSHFIRVYDTAVAPKGFMGKNCLKLKAIKNSYVVLEVQG